jgi:hypothetical protein
MYPTQSSVYLLYVHLELLVEGTERHVNATTARCLDLPIKTFVRTIFGCLEMIYRWVYVICSS